MRIAVIGRRSPTSEQVVIRALEMLRPTQLCTLSLTGLGAVVRQAASRLQVPFTSYWPDYRHLGDQAILVAADQISTVERPDLVLVLMPTDRDKLAVEHLGRFGHRCVLGTFDKGRNLLWQPCTPVPHPV